ncbi:unnamed protein product, partial [Effrenium voratum]
AAKRCKEMEPACKAKGVVVPPRNMQKTTMEKTGQEAWRVMEVRRGEDAKARKAAKEKAMQEEAKRDVEARRAEARRAMEAHVATKEAARAADARRHLWRPRGPCKPGGLWRCTGPWSARRRRRPGGPWTQAMEAKKAEEARRAMEAQAMEAKKAEQARRAMEAQAVEAKKAKAEQARAMEAKRANDVSLEEVEADAELDWNGDIHMSNRDALTMKVIEVLSMDTVSIMDAFPGMSERDFDLWRHCRFQGA